MCASPPRLRSLPEDQNRSRLGQPLYVARGNTSRQTRRVRAQGAAPNPNQKPKNLSQAKPSQTEAAKRTTVRKAPRLKHLHPSWRRGIKGTRTSQQRSVKDPLLPVPSPSSVALYIWYVRAPLPLPAHPVRRPSSVRSPDQRTIIVVRPSLLTQHRRFP